MKHLCKKRSLGYKAKRLGRTLIEEGMPEAARRRRNLRLWTTTKAVIDSHSPEWIHLPEHGHGVVDVSKLLALWALKNREMARKFVIYQRM